MTVRSNLFTVDPPLTHQAASLRRSFPYWIIWLIAFVGGDSVLCAQSTQQRRPNILFAVSDDQSFPHASAYGDAAIKTPNFDRVAKAGVLFRNAFTPAPGCSPMRAAFLTGREI